MLSVYDYSEFVISIGCDTVFLLRKYFCIVTEKKWYTEELKFHDKSCILNEELDV